MRISLVAAMSENRIIGRDGRLPWRLRGDLRRFRQLTIGHPVVMGRKTFESIGAPLPKRCNIVLSRDANWNAADVLVASDLERAMRLAGECQELFIIGGEEVYQQALPMADRIYLTVVHATLEGDTRFPEIDLHNWTLVEDERHEADEFDRFDYSFRLYEKAVRPSLMRTEENRHHE